MYPQSHMAALGETEKEATYPQTDLRAVRVALWREYNGINTDNHFAFFFGSRQEAEYVAGPEVAASWYEVRHTWPFGDLFPKKNRGKHSGCVFQWLAEKCTQKYTLLAHIVVKLSAGDRRRKTTRRQRVSESCECGTGAPHMQVVKKRAACCPGRRRVPFAIWRRKASGGYRGARFGTVVASRAIAGGVL